VSDYVPHEERIRKEKALKATAAAEAAAAHCSGLEAVTILLNRLGDSDTDCYLEILRPLRGVQRYFNKKATVTKSGLYGGPKLVIDEVLPAYRTPGGIVPPPIEGTVYPFDAYVVPDGRVWRSSGEGVTPNTYQLLASSADRLSLLSVDDLERIAANLRHRLPP